jgi:uncharacterized protein (TIGR03437 family)
MKNSKRTAYALILLVAFTVICFGQPTYTATLVQKPNGFSQSPFGLVWISDDGRTGFGFGNTSSTTAFQQCFSWQDGVASLVPVLANTDCVALAATVGIDVIGVPGPVDKTNGYGTTQLATLKNGQLNILTLPPGTSADLGPASVNKQGQIAVSLAIPADTVTSGNVSYTPDSAWLVSSDGKFTQLSQPDEAAGIAGINDSGDVAGSTDPLSDTTGAQSRAVIWSHTGQLINLTGLPGGSQFTSPFAINSKGQVVGVGTAPDGVTVESFFYDGVGNVTQIPAAGFPGLNARHINDNGEVVGFYNDVTDFGFMYDRVFHYANGVMTDLTQAATNLPSGLILYWVEGINNAGQIIADAAYLTLPPGATAGSDAGQYLLTPTSGPAGTTTPSVSSVVNGASFVAGTSSGTWITIQGKSLSTTTRGWTSADFVDGNLPTSLDGVSVTVNGLPAYPSYISPTQINVLAPEDATAGQVKVQVTKSQLASDSFPVTKKDPMPAFFLVASKYVAATHADGASVGAPGLVSGGNFTPAAPGETIQMFGTGFGSAGAAVNGKTLAAPVSLASPVTVTIGGKAAVVAYAGMTSPGLNQVNVTIPEGLPDGDAAVVATVDGIATPVNVFVTIKN